MLTRQGWLVTGASAALVALGRLIGLPELYALGTIGALLVGCSLALVGSSRPDLDVTRHVHPRRVHVGSTSRVEVRVLNRARSRSRVVRLRDPVSGTRGADLLVPRLEPNEAATVAYRLPTGRRGLLQVGPLSVEVGDPFGLARRRLRAAAELQVTVFPRVDDVAPMPYTAGHDPLGGVRRTNALGRTGEDFYALRPYVVGDDLRRVHWPSSARHDRLMVRQQEEPWQARSTVLLDVRHGSHPPASLELAVSAAASIVTATARRRDLVRLVTTAGADSDFGFGTGHVEAIMEHLAVLEPDDSGSLRRLAEHLGRHSTGGNLAVILGGATAADLRTVAGLGARYGRLLVVRIDRSAWDPSAALGPAEPGVALVSRAATFPTAWTAQLQRLRARSHSVGAP